MDQTADTRTANMVVEQVVNVTERLVAKEWNKVQPLSSRSVSDCT